MRPLRRWLALVVPAATAALVIAVPTVSTASAATARHGTEVAAADCEYISNYYAGGLQIEGNGVNEPVTLVDHGSCFTLTHQFTWHGYTGWEYQDLSGHCLWQDNGIIEVGAACQANHPNEQFFGYKLYSGQGWKVAVVADGTGSFMGSGGCSLGQRVNMVPGGDVCDLWNFPS